MTQSISIEVYPTDLEGRYTWTQAAVACEFLGVFGDGWRLPTREELRHMCRNKKEIGGFVGDSYWSSLECDASNAWAQSFGRGAHYYTNKSYYRRVRAVRDVKQETKS